MVNFAEFIRKHYQTIILSAVAVGLALGFWTTLPGKVIQGYSQALTVLMILFISLTITPRQFVMVARQPWAVIAGLALNFVFMPLLCWGLARLLVNDTALATGIILVGVVPCAGMAAVWTALLKGDVPLGMAINALTMVLAPFLIPPEIRYRLVLDSPEPREKLEELHDLCVKWGTVTNTVINGLAPQGALVIENGKQVL